MTRMCIRIPTNSNVISDVLCPVLLVVCCWWFGPIVSVSLVLLSASQRPAVRKSEKNNGLKFVQVPSLWKGQRVSLWVSQNKNEEEEKEGEEKEGEEKEGEEGEGEGEGGDD